jgi:hypothetical protein
MLWARFVKLESAKISGYTEVVSRALTVVDLPPELWTDNCGEYLSEDPYPCFLVHNVKLLESLAHGS